MSGRPIATMSSAPWPAAITASMRRAIGGKHVHRCSHRRGRIEHQAHVLASRAQLERRGEIAVRHARAANRDLVARMEVVEHRECVARIDAESARERKHFGEPAEHEDHLHVAEQLVARREIGPFAEVAHLAAHRFENGAHCRRRPAVGPATSITPVESSAFCGAMKTGACRNRTPRSASRCARSAVGSGAVVE